jgi:mono/diheme cytochrome c family protein
MSRKTWAMACLALLAGCSENEMDIQPKYQRPYQASEFFADGMSSRPVVAGTVARGQLRTDRAYYEGKQGDLLIDDVPRKVDLAFLNRGRERYNIYCSPCHNRDGDGQGMIVKRGFSPPPSFHLERLRDAPAGHFYNAITNGYGAMYSYASRVPVDDRWAIVAYIRALQLSQHAKLDDVPSEERPKLEGTSR